MDDSHEYSLSMKHPFADREIHRKGGSVLTPADDFAPDANNALLPRLTIMSDIIVMLFAKGRGHEHAHVFPKNLFRTVSERPLRGVIIDAHDSTLVDNNDAIDR